jgi:hypothetical protein
MIRWQGLLTRVIVKQLILFLCFTAPVTLLTAYLFLIWSRHLGIGLATVLTSMMAQTILFFPNKILTFGTNVVDREKLKAEAREYFATNAKFLVPEVTLVYAAAYGTDYNLKLAWLLGHTVLFFLRFRKVRKVFGKNGTPSSP